MDNTYKHRPEVGVLVDVHVAQVHKQRRHAVEEADNGHAYKELRRGGGVSHQVRGGDRAVADGGIAGDQGHLAQPGNEPRGKKWGAFQLCVGEGGLRFSPEGVLEVGVEGLVGAVAAQHGHNVPPKETATAPESKDRRELCGQKEKSYISSIQSSSNLTLDRRRWGKSDLYINMRKRDPHVMSQRELNTFSIAVTNVPTPGCVPSTCFTSPLIGMSLNSKGGHKQRANLPARRHFTFFLFKFSFWGLSLNYMNEVEVKKTKICE